jgi:hypothetical protein
MNKQISIAAAVAMALGAASAAQADSCSAPTYTLYIAGSSAAKNSFSTALKADLFGGSLINTFSSSSGDFESFCGTVATGAGATATGFTVGAVANILYRPEGGSVVGSLPLITGYTPQFLDLTGTGCNVTNPAVNGTSATVGTTDGWSGCVTQHAVELGVMDVEPSQFVGTNYPSAYSVGVWGTAAQTSLAALAIKPLFSQVFGIFVNTSGISPSGCAASVCGTTGQSLNLSREVVANVLTGAYKNWEYVPSASGGPVSTAPVTIHIKNREAGSGTRTGATIYFLGQCSSNVATLSDPAPTADFYATSDVLKAVGTQAGAISYASIDNNTTAKAPNGSLVSLEGVFPTNLAAALGQYDYWYEAVAAQGTLTSNGATNLVSWLLSGELENVATAPHAADIIVIPGVGTNPTTSGNIGPSTLLAADASSSPTIYVNPFTRGQNSCAIPTEKNE